MALARTWWAIGFSVRSGVLLSQGIGLCFLPCTEAGVGSVRPALPPIGKLSRPIRLGLGLPVQVCG